MADAATLAAMMDDLGVSRQDQLPIEHDQSRRGGYHPGRTVIDPNAKRAGSGWGALAKSGINDGEGLGTKDLDNLGGGRLHAAAHQQVQKLFNHMQTQSRARAAAQKSGAAVKTTSLGGVHRDGIPVIRFTRDTVKVSATVPLPQNPPQRIQTNIERWNGSSRLGGCCVRDDSSTPATSSVPAASSTPTKTQAQIASAHHQGQEPGAREGLHWSPPPPAQPGISAQSQDLSSSTEVVAKTVPLQNTAQITPNTVVTLIRWKSLCRITIGSGDSAMSTHGDLTVKLVQKGEEFVANFVFRLDVGTTRKIDWKRLKTTNFDIPGRKLSCAFTFQTIAQSEVVEDVLFMIDLLDSDKLRRLKEDIIPIIHDILHLDLFMATRGPEVLEQIERSSLSVESNGEEEEGSRVSIGGAISQAAAENIASRAGIPTSALTDKVRNLLRLSFARMVLMQLSTMQKGTPNVKKSDETDTKTTPVLTDRSAHVAVSAQAVTSAPTAASAPISTSASTATSAAVATQAPAPATVTISTPAPVPTTAQAAAPTPATMPASQVVIKKENEEEELIDFKDVVNPPSAVQRSSHTLGPRVSVTTTEARRNGRLVRKIITEQYIYEDGSSDVSSEL